MGVRYASGRERLPDEAGPGGGARTFAPGGAWFYAEKRQNRARGDENQITFVKKSSGAGSENPPL
jgi:hypothetical protein